jgi:hypothetical protein
MDLLEQIDQAQYREVPAGGMRWRVRAVDDSESLARHGAATLLALPVQALRDAGVGPEGVDEAMATLQRAQAAAEAIERGEDVSEPDREIVLDALAKIQRMAMHMHPRQREEQATAAEALVCAGVVGVWDAEAGDWRALRFVRGKEEADPSGGVLHVRSIRPLIGVLAGEIAKASTDARGWTAALTAFRRGPGSGGAGVGDRGEDGPHVP